MQHLRHLEGYSIPVCARILTTKTERSWSARKKGGCSTFAWFFKGRLDYYSSFCELAAGDWGLLGCGKDHTVNRCFAATFVPFFAKSWEHVHRLPVLLRIVRNARFRISITCFRKQVVDGREGFRRISAERLVNRAWS